jgi:hypothetical protein
MNQAEFHLKLVINLRCEAAPSRYTLDSQFRDIWARSGFKSRIGVLPQPKVVKSKQCGSPLRDLVLKQE